MIHSKFRSLKTAGASLLWDLASLFYPDHCTGCGRILHNSPLPFCQACILALPRTGFEREPENAVEKLFRGRVPVASACSIYYFTRDAPLQWMIHHLKYHQRPEVGVALGKLAGQALLTSGRFGDVDALLPLPLFLKREKERGYNQAEKICRGLGEVLGIPTLPHALQRVRKTDSQTRKNRMERWNNVQGSFQVKAQAMEGLNHVLLVDDVITTGATLDACCQAILDQCKVQVSICSLAYAHL
jgi:ComF family protein